MVYICSKRFQLTFGANLETTFNQLFEIIDSFFEFAQLSLTKRSNNSNFFSAGQMVYEVTFILISILVVTDYIQKRRGQVTLILLNIICYQNWYQSKINYMDQALVHLAEMLLFLYCFLNIVIGIRQYFLSTPLAIKSFLPLTSKWSKKSSLKSWNFFLGKQRSKQPSKLAKQWGSTEIHKGKERDEAA